MRRGGVGAGPLVAQALAASMVQGCSAAGRAQALCSLAAALLCHGRRLAVLRVSHKWTLAAPLGVRVPWWAGTLPRLRLLRRRWPADPYFNWVQVAEKMGDAVRILKIDTDQNPDISTQLQVCSGAAQCNSLAPRGLAACSLGARMLAGPWGTAPSGTCFDRWPSPAAQSASLWQVLRGEVPWPRPWHKAPPSAALLSIRSPGHFAVHLAVGPLSTPCVPGPLGRKEGRTSRCVATTCVLSGRPSPGCHAPQIHGLPTLIFVGMDASKPALRTEGLLPAQARRGRAHLAVVSSAGLCQLGVGHYHACFQLASMLGKAWGRPPASYLSDVMRFG